MGKLLVTNNREWGELLRKLFKKYQFEESMHMENITSYKKMYVIAILIEMEKMR